MVVSVVVQNKIIKDGIITMVLWGYKSQFLI